MIVVAQAAEAFGIQFFEYFLGDFQCIDPHFLKRQSVRGGAAFHKAVIKRDIVSDQYILFAEVEKI